MKQKDKPQAYIEMDERATTERILNRMTDPHEIEKREVKKAEIKRVTTIKERLSL